MEVLLNTTWLLVAVGAFLFWQFLSEGTARRFEHNRRYCFLALAVALILLFPVISLTDDLHSQQAAMEDSSRSIMKARNRVQGCLHAGRASFLATPHAAFSAADLYLFSRAVIRDGILILCPTLTSTRDGRSPPVKV